MKIFFLIEFFQFLLPLSRIFDLTSKNYLFNMFKNVKFISFSLNYFFQKYNFLQKKLTKEIMIYLFLQKKFKNS